MKEEPHLDPVINGYLETEHGFVQVFGNAEVRVQKCRVDHHEVQIGLMNVGLDVQLLKHL